MFDKIIFFSTVFVTYRIFSKGVAYVDTKRRCYSFIATYKHQTGFLDTHILTVTKFLEDACILLKGDHVASSSSIGRSGYLLSRVTAGPEGMVTSRGGDISAPFANDYIETIAINRMKKKTFSCRYLVVSTFVYVADANVFPSRQQLS